MSTRTELTVFSDQDADAKRFSTQDPHTISSQLDNLGLMYERWAIKHSHSDLADQAQLLQVYNEGIELLKQRLGLVTADLVSLTPEHPDKQALREKFLQEHSHAEDEVRFFIEGQGLFYIHQNHQVYRLKATQGDLIRVPAGCLHWFDMGPEPQFTCIRLFTNPQGWVAQYSGSSIADHYRAGADCL